MTMLMPEVYTDITTEMYKETSKKCAEIVTQKCSTKLDSMYIF